MESAVIMGAGLSEGDLLESLSTSQVGRCIISYVGWRLRAYSLRNHGTYAYLLISTTVEVSWSIGRH